MCTWMKIPKTELIMLKLHTKEIDEFKKIMGSYPTGVTVITTMDETDSPVGLTVNSFTSVSLEPMLISWNIIKDSSSCHAFRTAAKFAVNILAGDQHEECFLFANKN